MRSMKLQVLSLAAVIVLAAGIAAAQEGGSQNQNGIPVLPGLKQQITGNNPDEVKIAREVRHEIALLPYYTLFDDIRFLVNGRNVTLLGDVVNPALKRDAENAVKHIESVESVQNNINVLPPSPMDDEIRHAVARHVFSFGGLSRYSWEAAPSIHIIVKGGHVRLIGVVDSVSDRNAAGIQAKTVGNVFSVDNELQVANGNNNGKG
jgi:hyperosmotically inducible protein